MQYFFIPGRFPDLSLAELKSVVKVYSHKEFVIDATNYDYFSARTKFSTDDVSAVFNRLGGYIKYGHLVDLEDPTIIEYLIGLNAKKYAVSVYGNWERGEDREYAAKLNNRLKEILSKNNVKASFVGSGETQISAGSLVGNNILENGFELVVLKDKNGEIKMGLTDGVQDIEDYGKRDFEKPSADKEMGMLPPKLAQIMVNLTEMKPGGTLWDPFCGSGVILMEALLLGYDVLGSDISIDAVESSRDNIEWMGQNYELAERKFNTFEFDVTKGNKKVEHDLKITGVDGVAFEPYMGPPQTRKLHPKKADKLINHVTDLLKDAFELFERTLDRDTLVVAVVPSYLTYKGWETPTYMKFLSKKWKILNKNTGNKSLHWRRSNSIITRNLLVTQLKRK